VQIRNLHSRALAAPVDSVGALLDSLSSSEDRLWPRKHWPPMVLKDGLVSGSSGGHGPVRYVVQRYVPKRQVVFQFTRPKQWSGVHAFKVEPNPGGGTLLSHALEMKATGSGLALWIGIFRPLHDALIEDALDRAAVELGESTGKSPMWSMRVRMLRWLVRRLGFARETRRRP